MKKLFIDTNIIVDLIADRKPFSKYAIQLFQKAELKEIELFTSSHSIATTHYLLKKYLEEKELRTVLYGLFEYLQVIAVDDAILKITYLLDNELERKRIGDNAIVKAFLFELNVPFLIQQWQPVVFSLISNFKGTQTTTYYCDANAPPLFKLYSQYIFYA